MSDILRIVFAGTPEFAVFPLQSLLDCDQQIVAVYTQPDRPAGRGRKPTASPVKTLALKHALPVRQPISLKSPAIQAELAAFKADLILVVAYGLLLPPTVLNTPRLGCVNIHASLLPRWRGAAPIQRAILAGDTQTGITIMQMEAGLDTGPMLAQNICPIFPEDTGAVLHDRLAALGAQTLLESLPLITAGDLPSKPQDAALATYAAKLQKQEAVVDWQQPAQILERQVRAFNPWPVANTNYGKLVMRIWDAHAITGTGSVGVVIAATPTGIDVGTGDGLLRITRLQLPGRRAISAAEFVNAHDLRGVVLT